MATSVKIIMALSLACIILQACVLGFQINRWNEIVGALFSIVVSLVGYLPKSFGQDREQWFVCFYAFLLVFDLTFQLINMILLICFQWVVIQFCIHLNVSVDISDYGGVACNDWWHFGYGEINYRDRALIVTILLAVVVGLRLIQVVLSFAAYRSLSTKPRLYLTREFDASRGVHLSRAQREFIGPSSTGPPIRNSRIM